MHYAAAKSALRGFTEALAREVGRYDIQVNLLAPGLLDAGLSRSLPQHRLDEYLASARSAGSATAEEIAERGGLARLGRRTRFMTGAKVVVDGGSSEPE